MDTLRSFGQWLLVGVCVVGAAVLGGLGFVLFVLFLVLMRWGWAIALAAAVVAAAWILS